MHFNYPFVLGKGRMAFQSIHVQAQIKAFSEKEKRGIFIGKLQIFQRNFTMG
jgi:hypothetical protein